MTDQPNSGAENRCWDCRHLHSVTSCGRVKRLVVEHDLITGAAKKRVVGLIDAYKERESIFPWRCGRKGRHFKLSEKNND